MKKKFSVLLVLSMLLSMLAGCSGPDFATTYDEMIKAYNESSSEYYQEAMEERAAKEAEEAAKAAAEAEAAAAEAAAEAEAERIAAFEDVTILYTNDVHTYINNSSKDENENVVLGLSYANVAAMKKDLLAAGENVILVDAGDHVQGTAYGALDEGESIIDLMNASGYDLATLGNHEFDYGQFRAFELMDKAAFPYISCNFYVVEDGSLVLPSAALTEIGGRVIAFIGISTPETITKSTPAYFMDETMENYIYQFYSGADGTELYEAVQNAVDEVSEVADVVIALGHLGIDQASSPYTSEEVIANTVGIDAFIDGHSHSVVPGELVKNAAGEDVLLTQTGSYFGTIGKMTISGDTISTELIEEYENRDEEVDAIAQAWIDSVEEELGQEIGSTEVAFYINNPENPEERLIRRQETNLGDFVADSAYYLFNEVEGLDCDIAVSNGGGIRADIEPGVWSYNTCKTVQPFGNVLCMVEVTGQQILDCLEYASRGVGITSDEGQPLEIGGFQHVAGMTYEINSAIEPTVQYDEDKIWTGAPTGEYRVQNVKVYNKETATYEDLDLEKTYNVAGTNYVLRSMGDGMSMFNDSVLVKDYVAQDYLGQAAYIEGFEKDENDMPIISSATSPLAAYEGYLIDYENPNGAGRIVIK